CRGSLKRLFGQLGPELARIAVVICLAVISVFFSVIGPRIMADAINAVFSGAISQRLPVALTQQQVVESLRQSGQRQLAAMLSTIVGVLIMMLPISRILAVVSLLAVPASLFVTLTIVRRSQQQFVAQWSSTGALNGHVEEMHTGHSIVKVFGRQREAIERFHEENERLYNASYRAQFISGIIQPAMTFISNLNYVAIAVIGGLRVAAGQMSLGDVVAFIQY